MNARTKLLGKVAAIGVFLAISVAGAPAASASHWNFVTGFATASSCQASLNQFKNEGYRTSACLKAGTSWSFKYMPIH